MFKIVKRNEKGFTLIELMIVIAIIGVLAAIAIPQFNAYRAKSFNSAAESDVKNFLVSEASFFQDNQIYVSVAEAPGPVSGTLGAAPQITSAYGISNGVNFAATADANGASFVVNAKHMQGTREFASDSDGTAIFWLPGVAGVDTLNPEAPAAGSDQYDAIADWTAL